MNPHYNQNYTRDQIEAVLQTIHDCVMRGHFTIAKNENRYENRNFINNYNLNYERQKDILLKIEPEDFCHTLKNTKIGYEHEILYVFCPQMLLFNFEGEEEQVDIYTKFNIIECDAGTRVITISFHKKSKPVYYLFK
jgi:hypothetical protein